MKKRLSLISILEKTFLKKMKEFVVTKRAPVKLRSIDTSIFLDSFGNVYPSIMWDKKLGNIRESKYDLRKILESDETKEAKIEIALGKEPQSWTSCEAYQALIGDLKSFIF
ncbi:MAG: SPASM domain-containing protein [Candidatus Micrarchaeia archaeon]